MKKQLIIGCQIFAYDHTIDAPAKRGQNIQYFQTGLGFGNSLKPLSQIIEENGHEETIIDYLKVSQIQPSNVHYVCNNTYSQQYLD